MILEAALTLALAAGPTTTPQTAVPPTVTASPKSPAQHGRRNSTYTGRHYIRAWEAFRQCVAQREGRFTYGVVSADGTYYGTYQFTAALARGAAWEMLPELKQLFGRKNGRSVTQQLLRTPMNRWARFYQDMAFWTILNVDGRGEGASHWSGGRFTCTPGMPNYGGNR